MDKKKEVTFQTIKWEVINKEDKTLIYIYGLTKENKKVTVLVPNFKPFLYLELDPTKKWTKEKKIILKNYIEDKYKKEEEKPIKFIITTRKKNYYYNEGNFLKIFFNTKKHMNKLIYLIKNELAINGIGNNIKLRVHEYKAGEILQLFAIKDLKPTSWINVKQTENEEILENYNKNFSNCDIEIIADYDDIEPRKEINDIINPKILSYDIECISKDETGNTFPNAKNKEDKIICISATINNFKDDINKYKTFCLVNNEKESEEVNDNSTIIKFKNEKRLLLGWKKFINEQNPDIITGYNTLSFDDKYIINRSEQLLCWEKISDMGRLKNIKSRKIEKSWSSSAYGQQTFVYIDIPGILHIDMYPVISKDYTNLMSYTLDYVSEHFLNDNKIDLPAKEMIQMWHKGDKKDITKIIEYCNKDTILPIKLMKKLNSWLGLMEMSNVVNVQIIDLITRGQQIRVFSQVYLLCYKKKIVCIEKGNDYQPTDEEKEFVGATVQNPNEGYWELVATYDFKSLYPTTIIAYNICFSTFIRNISGIDANDYHTLEWTDHINCEQDKTVRKTKVKQKYCSLKYKKEDIEKVIKKELNEKLKGKLTTLQRTKIVDELNNFEIKKYMSSCKKHKYHFYKNTVKDKEGIIPKLLKDLLNARSKTKTEIKNLENKLKINNYSEKEIINIQLQLDVLDKRQLGYKVSANSMYGGFGSDYSYTPFYPAAASTTAMGRKSIQDSIDFATKYRSDTVVVYGDSVANYTPIYIRQIDDFASINVCTIEELADNYGSSIWLRCEESGKQTKEYCELENVETWTEQGWTKLHRVIRHKLAEHKKMVRILTHTGMVDVTDDHSLLSSDGSSVSPKEVEIGTELLHRPIVELYTNKDSVKTESCSIDEAKIYGFFFGEGSCGVYNCPSGKYSWALNNADMNIITKYLELCKKAYPLFEWKFYDTLKSSGAYKISFNSDDKKQFITDYRENTYYNKCKIIPSFILNGNENIRKAFWEGLYDADGDKDNHGYTRFDQKNQISASHICLLAQSIGYKTSINTRNDKPNIYRITCTNRCQRKNPVKVKKIDYNCLKDYDDYVYDLTTENHHFAAGIGNMIVHNTDSCMLHFKDINNIKECFKICNNMEKEINAIFPEPMYLELEKIYSKYFLLSKKRYIGYIVDDQNKLLTTDNKGVVTKRRDNCGILRDIYSQLIELIMEKKSKNDIYTFLCIEIKKLLNGQVPLEKLIITKSIKDENAYKNKNLPHLIVAKKMRNRGKYVASGTRIKYIFIKTDNKNDTQYKKAEDPEHYSSNKDTISIDYLYYFEKQLINPIDEVLLIKFKSKDLLKNLFKILKNDINFDIDNYFNQFKPSFILV